MNLNKQLIFKITIIILIGLGTVYYFLNQPSSLNQKLSQKLDKMMEDSLSKYKSPGMILAVWTSKEGRYVKAKGLADIKTKRKMEISDKFRIGSLTKTFTTTVVLELIDEGKLGLNDTLDKYMAKIPNSKNITIKQLLNMTSGLHNYTEVPSFQERIFTNRFFTCSPNEMVDIGLSKPPYFSPGKGYHYSNTNTFLLGMIVEKLTKNKLENEIQKRIIDKLKLKDTTFPIGSIIEGKYCSGYQKTDGVWDNWTKQNPSWAWAAGAMISNIFDLKIFIKAVSDGTFLSPKFQQIRLTDWSAFSKKPQFPTLKYGLGVFIQRGFVGHNGGQPGYVDMAMYNPADGTIIVFMLNTQPDGACTLEIFEKIIDILYPN